MKQSIWNHLISYFKDVHIESAQSIFNDELDVLLVKGEYQLVTPEAIYSYGTKYDNYFQAFKKIKIKNISIDNVLVLGLGLGSIPYMLEKYFKCIYSYTAVEIDEAIIYLASKYVLDGLESDVTTMCTNALTYVEIDTRQYDLIAMDVFISDYIPEEFETLDYLQKLAKRLSPNGIILFNRLYHFEKDKKKTDQYFKDVFLKVFPKGSFVEINGNKVLTNLIDHW